MTTDTSPLPSSPRAEAAALAFAAAFDRTPTAARLRTLWQLCADLLAHHAPGGQAAALAHEEGRLGDSFSPEERALIDELLAGAGRRADEEGELGAEVLAARAALARRLVLSLGYPVSERWSRRARRVVGMALAVGVVIAATGAAFALRPPRNLAAGRPVRASSAYGDSVPGGLVDGDKTKSPLHTDTEGEPWAEIDLGSVTSISGVGVWNRSDSPGEIADRVLPLLIEVSTDGKQFQVVARRARPFVVWRPTFPTVEGRYVRLHVARKSFLHVNEVEVYR